MDQRRKLPTGVQSFEKLRTEGYLYVDKTQYIWDLVENGSVYFLSRPRRLGKSLLVSTMEAYFRGKRELFDGLEIQVLEDARGEEAWAKHPVITFSLSGGGYHAPDGLERTLATALADVESRYGIGTPENDLPNRFRQDLKRLHEKTGRRVVVLVDEDDGPVLATMDEEEARLYSGFFCVLKDEDEHLEFEFFAASAKFGRLSVFSDLNHLNDISLDDEYAGICGFTEGELRRSFGPEIDRLAGAHGLTRDGCLEKLSATYGGYRFAPEGQSVYNPFSLLNALSDQAFGRYWFESGDPTPLVKKLQASGFRPEQFTDGVEATDSQMKDYRTENPDPIPLFYQSGYLTIAGYDRRFRLYDLAFPNEEVRYGFLNSLAPYVLGEADAESPWSAMKMTISLEHGDAEALRDQLSSLFAGVPYIEGRAPEYEAVWRDQVYLVFALLGQFVACEVHTAKGRCDVVVQTADYVWVFELKVDGSAQEALAQIEERGYAERFAADSRKLLKIGVSFSSEERNIAEWEVSA